MNDALSALSTIVRYAGVLDVGLPAPVVEVVEMQAAISDALLAEPTTTLLADLAGGTLKPAGVKAAIAATVAAMEVSERRFALAPDIDQALGRRARGALQAAGDEIIARCRPAFDAAAATLAASVEALGVDVDLGALATATPGAIEAWQGRAGALSTLDSCRRLRDALAYAGYGRGDIAPVATWIAAAKNTDHLATAQHAYRGADRFVGVVGAGFTLRMNTAAEAEQVAAIAGAASARAIEEAKAKALEDTKNDPHVLALKRYADSIGQPA